MNTTSVSLAAGNEKAVGLFESPERSRVKAGADEVWLMGENEYHSGGHKLNRNLNLSLPILHQSVFAVAA